MQKLFFLIFFVLPVALFSQSAEIQSLEVIGKNQTLSISGQKMFFPIINTGIQNVDSLINNDLRRKILGDDYAESNPEQAIKVLIQDGLNWLNFEVSYNNNGYLSLQIVIEYCKAYCEGSCFYLNYSTLSGKPILLPELIDTTGKFSLLLREKAMEYYEVYQKELAQNNEPGEAENLEFVKTEVMKCKKEFAPKNFALYPEYIEFYETCDLPHYLQNYIPEFELKYYYREIHEYLKVRNLKP